MKDFAEFCVGIVVMGRVKRKECDGVFLGQVPEDIVATDFPARIGGQQSASLDPKNPHEKALPANSFVSGGGLESVLFFQIDQIDYLVIRSNELS